MDRRVSWAGGGMSAATKTRMLRSKSKGDSATSALAEAAPMLEAKGAISPATARVALVQTTLTPTPKRHRSSSGATSTGALRRVTIACFRPDFSTQ